jgi:protein phosphatase 1L
MWICDILFGNLDMFAGETYRQTDADFLDSERDTFRDDGSTASTAVLVGNHLYVANVGDSRAVISMAGKGNTCIINFPF